MCECKICGKTVKENGLVRHVMSAHSLTGEEYFHEFFPRKSRFYGEMIPFFDKRQYFEQEFISEDEIYLWAEGVSENEFEDWLAKKIKKRIESKNLLHSLSHLDFETVADLPSIVKLQNKIGDYNNFCNLHGLPQPLYPRLRLEKNHKRELVAKTSCIAVDTREQQPLTFKNQVIKKLSFGDYTIVDEGYNYAYVDRKNVQDFKSTVTAGFDRFCREIKRAQDLNCVIFVVVEGTIKGIEEENSLSRYPSKMSWVWNRTREICHKFPKTVQFVFSGSREESERIIPFLLAYGIDLADVDIQFILDKKASVCGK